MIVCMSCQAGNVDGARFCSKCGAALTAPAPESWRIDDEWNQPPATSVKDPTPSYTVPRTQPPSSASPTYTPPPPPLPNITTFNQPTTEGIHPLIPAIISFFFPGLGLLFVSNKMALAIGIFIGYLVFVTIYSVISVFLMVVGVGFCMIALTPLLSVLAAIHSYDETAKASNGKFNPILFKE